MSKLKKIMVGYARVPNTLLNDEAISLKAKGLFAYIESKPDDWDFSVERIARALKEGTSAVGDGIKELEKSGYLIRQRYQDEHGHWLVQYVLTDQVLPLENPTLENPIAGKPINIKKKVSTNKVISNNKDISTNVDIGDTAVIEEPPEKIASNGELVRAYGDPDVELAFQYWVEIMGYEITSQLQKNRFACKNLLKKTKGIVDMRRLIDGVAIAADDKYAPRISDFCELQQKVNELMLWGRKNHMSGKVVKI